MPNISKPTILLSACDGICNHLQLLTAIAGNPNKHTIMTRKRVNSLIPGELLAVCACRQYLVVYSVTGERLKDLHRLTLVAADFSCTADVY